MKITSHTHTKKGKLKSKKKKWSNEQDNAYLIVAHSFSISMNVCDQSSFEGHILFIDCLIDDNEEANVLPCMSKCLTFSVISLVWKHSSINIRGNRTRTKKKRKDNSIIGVHQGYKKWTIFKVFMHSHVIKRVSFLLLLNLVLSVHHTLRVSRRKGRKRTFQFDRRVLWYLRKKIGDNSRIFFLWWFNYHQTKKEKIATW